MLLCRRARRLGTLSADAYVFYDVEAALSDEMAPLVALWDGVMDTRHPERQGASEATRHALRPKIRLGVGGGGAAAGWRNGPPPPSRRLAIDPS